MGLFSMLKNKIEEQKEKQRLWAERKAKEAEDDAKRASTTTIPFFKLEESMPNIIALKDKKIDTKRAFLDIFRDNPKIVEFLELSFMELYNRIKDSN